MSKVYIDAYQSVNNTGTVFYLTCFVVAFYEFVMIFADEETARTLEWMKCIYIFLALVFFLFTICIRYAISTLLRRHDILERALHATLSMPTTEKLQWTIPRYRDANNFQADVGHKDQLNFGSQICRHYSNFSEDLVDMITNDEVAFHKEVGIMTRKTKAIYNGNLALLQELHNNCKKWCSTTFVDVFKNTDLGPDIGVEKCEDQMECMEWAWNNGCEFQLYGCNCEFSHIVVMLGRLDALKFGYANGIHWDDKTSELAAVYDSLDCLEYLWEHGCRFNSQALLKLVNKHALSDRCAKFITDVMTRF